MISSDLFIMTPFQKDQIDLASSKCQVEPDLPYSSYSVFVFRSRLEPFLKRYFDQTHRKKYNYDSFVFRDIPLEGKMVSTLILIDSDSQIISLTPQEIRDINLEISEMIVLYPNYLLFIQDSLLKYPRTWVRTILPYLEFERTTYYPDDDSEVFKIPSIYHNGSIYLDLSLDPNYDTTLKKLYTDILEKLDDFYYKGTIPNEIEASNANGVKVFFIQPGDFLQFQNKLGDQVLEDLADIEDVSFEKSDFQFTITKKQMDDSMATVFVLNFAMNDMNFDLLGNQVGVEFLVSLKKFLQADEIITKNRNPGVYEIMAKKDGKFMQSNLDIKEMFGFSYFTDDPLGLLVLDDMDLLDDSKAIYDTALGKGGIFVPIEKMGDVIQLDILHLLLSGKRKNYDCYTKSEDIELSLTRQGLKISIEIENYLFVEKDNWITKRIIYRGCKEKYPKMLLSGSWHFDQISLETINQWSKEIMDQLNFPEDLIQQGIEQGPFDSIVVSSVSKDYTEQFLYHLEEKLYSIQKSSRKF
jgi:hypothetical protein